MDYKDIDKDELAMLLDLEKAAKIVCVKYENEVRRYDGLFDSDRQYELKKFEYFNKLRNGIINDIEEYLSKVR